MSASTSQERQSALAQRVHDSDVSGGLRNVSRWGFYPDWYWGLISRIDVVVQEAPVRYVTAALSESGGEVTVITDALMVRATVTEVQDFDTDRSTATVAVKAVPLRLVRAVQVVDVSERSARHDWPARLVVRLEIEHEDGYVRLPAGELAWSGPGEELAPLLPRLIAAD